MKQRELSAEKGEAIHSEAFGVFCLCVLLEENLGFWSVNYFLDLKVFQCTKLHDAPWTKLLVSENCGKL